MPVLRIFVRETGTHEPGFVHYDGVGPGDYTLCCLDTAGDPRINLHGGETTKQRVNCPDCIAIVKHVRRIRDRVC